ncbi:hypothetical protein SPHN_05005 [Sphingomonas faeni]|nr:hypothetical protein [Sphingomonas faeni]
MHAILSYRAVADRLAAFIAGIATIFPDGVKHLALLPALQKLRPAVAF